MPRFLSEQDADEVGNIIQNYLSALEEQGRTGTLGYQRLYQEFNNFDAGSNTAASIEALATAARLSSQAWEDELRQFVGISIRTSNYPSNWDASSRNARDLYRNGHPGTALNTWRCPGYNVLSHNAGLNDCTIDHVVSVVQHWNTTGRNCNRQLRVAWYYDVTNHQYLCQACNSRRGGVGNYNIVTGPLYTN